MKHILLTFILLASAFSAWAVRPEVVVELKGDNETPTVPQMQFEEQCWNFGDIERKGGDVRHDFMFTNMGDKPLVILRVVTTCSCVKASYPKRPIAVGEKGMVRITFEPHKSEPGVFSKVIQIYTNTRTGRQLLTVQGNSLDGRNGETKQKTKQ